MKLSHQDDLTRILLILIGMYIYPDPCLSQTSFKLIGMNKIEHTIEPSLQYEQPHSKDLSARYQLFIHNTATQSVSTETIKSFRLNSKTPAEWHQAGILAWYLFPEQDLHFPKEIPANGLMVWQFNGKNDRWLTPSGIRVSTSGFDTTVANEDQLIYIASAVFTGDESELAPDLATLHLSNHSTEDLRIRHVVFWQPANNASWPFLFPGKPISLLSTIPEGRILRAGNRSIVQIRNDALRLGPVALQVILEDRDGFKKEIWAYQKVKKEVFDISAGWANYPIKGRPGFLNDYFLKTLRSLYITTAHYNGQPGYTDDPDRFSTYPIKYFGHLVPWDTYDKDSLLPRIHGIEILGEPQYGGGTPVDPQKVCMELLPFAPSRIPTTLTHSEERIWRFYAGLSDYPHYDAYRVSAPSADKWENYDRWKGQKIGWGSPLETIGTMTRSLRSLNRPAPIAYWSQGPHEGWEVYDGRTRTSPTPSELRVQAYQALSSGITSLYWFNLSYASLIKYPDLLEPMQRIGREIRLLDSFYIQGMQWEFETTGSEKDPLWDLSTLVAPQGILLFAIDLDYRIDTNTKTFVFLPDKKARLYFKVPTWVNANWSLLRFGKDGPQNIPYSLADQQLIEIKDTVTEVGIYMLIPSTKKATDLKNKWQELINSESHWDFDPAKNQYDLKKLMDLEK